MKRSDNRLRRYDSTYWLIGVIGLCLVVAGCSIDRHTVIAATGTNLGVELTADPSTQTPRMKVGYNRSELALVPSNRSAEKDVGSRIGSARCNGCCGDGTVCTSPEKCQAELGKIHDGGAADTAEVLMEIRMSGGILFSGISDGNLYQRLAVGKTAVQQPGAALMFAKNPKGEISTGAVTAIQTLAEQPAAVRATRGELARAYMSSDKKSDFDAAAQAAGYTVQSIGGRTLSPFQVFQLDNDFKDGNPGLRAAAEARLKVLLDELRNRGISVAP
jgi:hypothetical protein